MKYVVRHQGIRLRAHAGARYSFGKRERIEAGYGGAVRWDVGVEALDGSPVHLERDGARRNRFGAPIGEHRRYGRGSAAAVLAHIHPRDRDVGGGAVTHVHLRESRACRERRKLASVPPRSLCIRDEHSFTPLARRITENSSRQTQRGIVAGSSSGRTGRVDRRTESRLVACECAGGRRRLVEVHDGRTVLATQVIHYPGRGGASALPAIAVRHAVRTVEQDDDIPRAGRRAGEHRCACEKRPRERQRQQRYRGATEREEKQIPQPLTPHRLIRDSLQKHERREAQHRLALPVRQVHEHWDRHRGEAEQEPGGEETRHQRTRASRSRRLRKSKSA